MKILLLILFPLICITMSCHNAPLNKPKTLNNNEYRSFIQYPLSAGLPKSLRTINSTLKRRLGENIVYVIVHKPEIKLNYDSPNTFKSSLINIDPSKIDVGHVQLAWSCKIRKKLYESATGFTGDLNNLSVNLVSKGFGLSPFVSTFVDGSLESPLEVQDRIVSSLQKKKLTVLAVNIGKNCAKVIKNIWDFVNSKRSNYFSIANLINNDGGLKGHNCTSLVIEWLRPVKDLHLFLTNSSLQKMKVPRRLFGNPVGKNQNWKFKLPQMAKRLNRHVSLISLAKKWDGGRVGVRLYDPGSLISSINDQSFEENVFEVEGESILVRMFL